jgi:hypothetical protein
VIGTDCIGSGKSNYHSITITTAPSTGMLKVNRLENLIIITNLYKRRSKNTS